MIIFGLGSNLGNRLGNLRAAVERLREFGDIARTSEVFETEPWGVVAQPKFLNACVMMQNFSQVEPLEILQSVKQIERELGRVENIRWGARKIDVDILLINDMILDTATLKIPHVNLHERLFVLRSLLQISPDWIHPLLKISVRDMYERIAKTELHQPLRICKL